MTIQMKAIQQLFFHGIVFIMMYKVVLTFEPMDESLVFDNLNESY